MSGNRDDSGNNEEIRIVEEYVEGYWICPKCETRCRGAQQECHNCGAVRDENVKFFLDDDSPVISDEDELAKAKAGPDWICGFCGNTSPSDSPKCTGCGSYRDGSKRRAVKDVPKEPAKARPSEPAKPMPMGCKAGCSIFLVLMLILLALSCQQKSGQLEILSASWQRGIEREQYQTVKESAWQSELPTTAREISRSREIRKYNEIPDGFEEVDETYTEKEKVGEKRVEDGVKDLGNGRFQKKYKVVPEYREVKKTRRVKKQKFRKEPVYENKIHYEIDKWMPIEKVTASGIDNDPAWPDSKAVKNATPRVGDIREGQRKEEFKVKAVRVSDKKEYEFNKLSGKPLTYEQFMKLRKGTTWEAVFSGLGGLNEIIFDAKK